MKAIQVRFLPTTSFRGGRVKAFCEGNIQIIRPFQYEISNFSDQAKQVAQELINKMEWKVTISGIGMLPNGDYAVTLAG